MNWTARRIAGVVAILAVVIVAWSSMFTVHQAEMALVVRFGAVRETVRDPGLHFKLPLVDGVESFDARLIATAPPAEEVILGDQKRIVVDTYTLYRIVDPLIFYQAVRTERQLRSRLDEVVNASVRQVLGNYPITDVLSPKREAIMHEILAQVSTTAKSLGIIVVDARIRHADLPQGTSSAIFARMKSERQREAAQARAEGQRHGQEIRATADRQRTVILAQAQQQGQIARGEGDAEASRTYAQAFQQDPQFFEFYRSLEAYRQSLGGTGTSYVLTPDSSFFKYFESLPGALGASTLSATPAPTTSPTPSH